MSKEIEEKLDKIPVINWLVRLLKNIRLPGFEGLSIYDLIEMYIRGIVEGALSTRASSIAFSLFLALFPLKEIRSILQIPKMPSSLFIYYYYRLRYTFFL